MHQVVIPLERRGFGETMRRDAWWGQPLLTFVVLGGVRRLRDVGGAAGQALRVRAVPLPFLFAAALR